MKVLERRIDGWIDAGGETVSTPRKPDSETSSGNAGKSG